MKRGITKDLQKLIDKHGSVLKAYKAKGNDSVKTMVVILVACLFVVLLVECIEESDFKAWMLFVFYGSTVMMLILVGSILRKWRINNYLKIYQKETGYSAEELLKADRELMGDGAVCIVAKPYTPQAEPLFIITEHYFMTLCSYRYYLTRLDDIVVAFNYYVSGGCHHENGLLVIRRAVRRDVENNFSAGKQYHRIRSYLSGGNDEKMVCKEALEEITKRVPHVITKRYINGIQYDLLQVYRGWQEDLARILGE